MRSTMPGHAPALAVVLALLVLFLYGCSASTAKGPDGEAVTAEGTDQAPEPSPEVPEVPEIQEITLPRGTELLVRTTSRISTKTHQPGQSFVALLEQPIVDGDWVIARKGAAVEGLITECDPGGRMKGVASLAVRLQRLALADGRMADIQTSSVERRARTTKKKDGQKIGIGAGIGAAIGAIAGGGKGAAIGAAAGGGAGTGLVLATHGDPATIPSESKLTFKLAEPVTVTRRE